MAKWQLGRTMNGCASSLVGMSIGAALEFACFLFILSNFQFSGTVTCCRFLAEISDEVGNVQLAGQLRLSVR